VTSDFHARSFDKTRERPAPDALTGHWSDGDDETVTFGETTLVVAIKPHCDGCREFLNADPSEIPVPVLVISADEDENAEWRDTRRRVLVAPGAFELLDIRWPPLYVLIDPTTRRVVCEGVLFGSAQVAAEIAAFLER
jgi:hypothetical protein